MQQTSNLHEVTLHCAALEATPPHDSSREKSRSLWVQWDISRSTLQNPEEQITVYVPLWQSNTQTHANWCKCTPESRQARAHHHCSTDQQHRCWQNSSSVKHQRVSLQVEPDLCTTETHSLQTPPSRCRTSPPSCRGAWRLQRTQAPEASEQPCWWEVHWSPDCTVSVPILSGNTLFLNHNLIQLTSRLFAFWCYLVEHWWRISWT